MDLGGVPLSATQAAPAPAEVYPKPKVSLSSSSGSSSLPIRAPPTVDSDFELSISTNGQGNKGSSFSSSSDSGFESDGFVSGEDGFDTASEMAFVADPDDETLEEVDIVENYGVSRPFVTDTDDETLATPVEEDDEYGSFAKPAVVDIGVSALRKTGVPIAMLSRDSDDDSVGTEEVDDDGFLGAVRVPGIHISGKSDSAIKVKVFGVEEGEDESQFETALEDGVVEDSDEGGSLVVGSSEGYIDAKDSVNDPVSAELIRDKGLDDAQESTVESFVASKDDFLWENSEINKDVPRSAGEIHRIENMDQRESELKGRSVQGQNGVGSGDHGSVRIDDTTPMDMVIDYSEHKEMKEGSEIIVCGIDEADPLIDETKGTTLMDYGGNVDGEIAGKEIFKLREAEVLEGSGAFVLGSDLTNCVSGETVGSELLEAHAMATQVVEQSIPSVTVEANMQEMEFDFAEVGRDGNFGEEFTMDYQNSKKMGVDVSETVIHSWSSDDEKLEGVNEQRIDLGVGLHDFVDSSSAEPVDSVIAENGLQNTDSTRFSEPYPAQEAEDYGNGPSPGTTECNVIEEEMEDEAGQYPDNSEEGSFSENESKGLIFGISDTTKLIMEDLEQSLTPTSRGESSQDLLHRTESPIIGDTDEEVDTDGESEGKELFDSTVLAALLKAATGAGSDGGSFSVTSGSGSRIFSLEHPADSSTSINSLRPALQADLPSLFTGSELTGRARGESEENLSEEEKKKLEKIQLLRVKFLRLVQRLGQSPEDSIAAQVLYRLVLTAGRPSSQSFSLESAKRIAMQLEAEGKNDLDFSLNILVLGKTGVGKSATINSIFGEKKAVVDAFDPATTSVKDVLGTIDGIKVRIFDTPGLRSSLMEQSFNRKILLSIKKLTKKCPPDIVLYVDRLDTETRDLNDLPLLRSITSLLGSSIWHNAIVTLTHAASSPPDGPSGSPLSYDLFVAQRSRVIQQLISQAVGDLRMMNPSLMSPVSLVENHPSCQKREDGQIVLPNGESWRPQLLLLCYSMKILSEANSVAKAQDLFDHRKLFGFRARSPPLPYFLSSLLQSNAHPKLPAEQGGDNVDSDTELGDFSDSDHEDEDEYDQLPPFKPLKRSQIAKLSQEQRKAYFEEYDYRVRLLQKKQRREEVKMLRELKKRDKDGPNNYGNMDEDGDEETESPAAVAVPLPDMVLPPSFDGDNPAYRYRFLEPMSQLLTRPVLDLHGWDHDCGYDAVSLESSLSIAGCLPAVIAVQITKDKKDFNIHWDSSVAAKHGENGSTMAGFDIQTVGKQLAYILKGETKIKNFKTNKTAAGVSVIFLGENVATGLKIEDRIAVGKRLVLVGSTGAIRSQSDTAYGANLEVRLREMDFPLGQDQTTLGLSLMRWRGDVLWGGNLQSQFSIGRSSKMVVRAGLNNKLSGQVSVRTSSSEQLQIALLGILPIANAIFRNFFPRLSEKYQNQ